MYEVLQNVLPMPGQKDEGLHSPGVAGFTGDNAEGRLKGHDGPASYLRSRNALKIILDLDGGFGLGGGAGGKAGREVWTSLPRIMGGTGGS